MVKAKVAINADSEEFQETLRYLLCRSGYFDVVSGDSEDVELLIEGKTDDMVKNSYTAFQGELLQKLGMREPEKRTDEVSGIKTIAIATFSGGTGATYLSLEIAGRIFDEGKRSLYVSLSPCNMWDEPVEGNSMGYERWLMDSRNNRMGPIGKYIEDGVMYSFMGAPVINHHAGDVISADINNLKKIASVEFDYLILDIGNHLDLERKRIFEEADIKLGAMKNVNEESIFKKIFSEGIIYMEDEKREERLNEIIKLLGIKNKNNSKD